MKAYFLLATDKWQKCISKSAINSHLITYLSHNWVKILIVIILRVFYKAHSTYKPDHSSKISKMEKTHVDHFYHILYIFSPNDAPKTGPDLNKSLERVLI